MKIKILILLLLLLMITGNITAGELTISGIYQGKNLHLMNPYTAVGSKIFCVTQILINGKAITTDINSSSYEIDFSEFNLKIGDRVDVIIKHKDGCQPKIVNKDVLKPVSTFEMVGSIRFDEKLNQITWETTKESGPLPFDVQQKKWNKWVTVGTVEGLGNADKNNYSYPVLLHSGDNVFRVRQRDFTGKDNFGTKREFVIKSRKPPVTFEPKKPDKVINFSAETDYEIFNSKGEKVLSGRSRTVKIDNLPKGEYHLNFDSQTQIFKK